jgi:hypothetical protein
MHSSISLHLFAFVSYKYPLGQGCGSAGQLSQGLPQALPIVEQQSALVQTTPES